MNEKRLSCPWFKMCSWWRGYKPGTATILRSSCFRAMMSLHSWISSILKKDKRIFWGRGRAGQCDYKVVIQYVMWDMMLSLSKSNVIFVSVLFINCCLVGCFFFFFFKWHAFIIIIICFVFKWVELLYSGILFNNLCCFWLLIIPKMLNLYHFIICIANCRLSLV